MSNKEVNNQNIKKAMQEELARFLQNRESAKTFSLCMQESNQWLKERKK
ncbi:hypothetical protein MNB_SM-5-36 [hydrothermal vent metagenome]|uniref:Uncharacterized protein n=1 Tax=hydrothermal vent metagenome TaxID=652676 RepID=A0A1W1BNJ8_9ZZZZ